MKNLILRTATGVLFVALLVGGMMAGATYFAVLFTIITALTLWEFAANINLSAGGRLNPFLLAAAGELIFLLCFALASGHGAGDHLTQNLLVALLLALILIPVSELYLKGGNPLRNWAYTFAALIYIALPFGLLAFTAFPAGGNDTGYVYALPLSVFVFLWANDTGAYCVGSLLHRRFPAKLFPSVSPAKSWIGSIGGCLVTLGIAFAAHTMSDVLTLPQWLGFGRYLWRPCREPDETHARHQGQRPPAARTRRSAGPLRLVAAGHPRLRYLPHTGVPLTHASLPAAAGAPPLLQRGGTPRHLHGMEPRLDDQILRPSARRQGGGRERPPDGRQAV